MPHSFFVCRLRRACGLVIAALLLSAVTASAQLTWDANTSTAGIQEGDGTWNTTSTNWYNGTSNVAWNNTTNATTTAVFGLNTATAGGTITVSGTINLGGMKFSSFASAPTFAHTFTGGTLAFADNAVIEMADLTSTGSTTNQFVNLNSTVTGNNLTIQRSTGASGSFQYLKFGGTANANLVGTLTIKANSASVGIFVLVGAAAANSSLSRVVVESGSTYAISGAGNTYAVPMTIAGLGQNSGAIRLDSNNQILSGAITLSGNALIHSNTTTTGTVISAAIGETGGSQGFQRSAILSTSTVTFTGISNFTGSTTWGRTSANGGVSIFDFTAAGAPVSNMFYNGVTAGVLNMIGGNSGSTGFTLLGKAGTSNSQAFGNLIANGSASTVGGLSVITLISDTGGRMDLSLGTITRSGQGLLAINGAAAGDVTSTLASGFLGPWATYRGYGGTAGWAQVVGGKVTNGFVGDLLYATGTAISSLAGYSTGGNLNVSVKSTGNITVTGTTTDLNTLTMNDSSSDRLIALPSSTLRLGVTGGIQIDADARSLVIGQSGSAGTLTAGGSTNNTTGQLIVTNNSSTSTLTINSLIANNGSGAVTLLFNSTSGGKTILTNANTYTGGTTIVSGVVEMQNAAALGSSGTVTVQEGAALQLSGSISLTRALSIGGSGTSADGVIRNLSGSNSLGGLVTLLSPSRINADSGTLTLFLTSTSTNIITGTQALTFGGAGSIVVGSRIATSSGILVKDGTGTLTLAGDNTYTGATTVSAGTLKLGSTTGLGASSSVTISAGGTIDLNGQTSDRNYSMNGAGTANIGALINSSGITATVTGTTALGSATSLGGSGNITISNATGLTGNVLLTKTGGGTLTVIDSTTTSARTGTNEIDAGTLRIQSASAIAPVGTGAYAMNGGTLSLGFDVADTMTNVVNVISSSTIISDRASAGAGSFVHTLSTLTIGSSTLTVKAGDNVTSGTIGLTLGAVSIGGVSMRPGNPVFDVQSSANAAMTLTLAALSDQAIGPRTITFQNSGAAASTVVLGTLATSLVDGTVVNINSGANAGVTVNMNVVGALGGLSQVNVYGNSTLTTGITSVVLGSLGGTGTVNASGAFTLIVGNASNATLLSSTFSGVLANGSGTLALTKAGLGTLTLSGSTSNTYTGATTVSAGTLILGKTGGAVAVPGALAIGASAASTAGNATLQLNASDQAVAATTALTMNAGSTLNLNGFNLTVLTWSSSFGATVTGSGILAINNTSGTLTFTGVSSISSSSTLQLTATGASASRTMAMTNVTDQLTINGTITQGTNAGNIVAGNSTQTALGTLILTGTNTYTGSTTVSSGILNIRSAAALGSTAGTTTVTSGATLQIQGGITTLAETLTLNGGSGFAGSNGINMQTGAFVNVSGVNNYAGTITLGVSAVTISSDSGTLNLTNAGNLGGAFGLTLAGAGDGSITSIINIGVGVVTKNGTGTWTLKGVNTSTGGIVINAGTLKLGDGTTGRWNNALPLSYTGSGTFEFGGSTTASTQALGALTLTSGSGVLKVDAPASGTNALTFASLVTPALGSGLNIVSPAGTSVTITGTSNTNGIIDPRITYNGANYAASASGVIGAAATTMASSSMSAGNSTPYLISGSFTQTDSVTINAGLKFSGGDTLTLGNGTLLTLNNGANTAGGILVTGGVNAIIADEGTAAGLTTGGAGDLVIGTDAAGDSLDIQVVITSTTTGGLTKNGAGTLTLTATNAYTGATSLNAGRLVLGNAGALSTSTATVQVGAVLDLNGKIVINTAVLNGTGISSGGALINSSAAAASIGALTIGLGNGTGGIGASIGGTGSITSTGVLTGNSLLVKSGSGTLTLGDNAGTPLASTRTGYTRIDAGTLRISNSTSALGTSAAAIILNGGILSLGSTASVVAYPVSVTASSTIISDVYTSGAGLTHTLGVLAIGTQTLTIQAGGNVTTGGTNAGVTFGATTLLGSPTFDVQSPTTAAAGTTTLTLGALSDQGVAKTITFANSGASTTNSIVILGTAMASLVDGTMVYVNSGPNAGVTLNLNLAAALGTLAQVTVNGNSILNIGAAQTIGSLSGSGTVTASGAFALTVGNASSGTPLSTNFTGTLGNGTGTLSLTKSGLGTFTLSGASTYTGTTTVSLGILKLNNATALGSTSGVTISAGGTVDLNGQTTDRNFSSVSGTGHAGLGAIINSSSTMAIMTGTLVQGAAAKIGGSGDIFINNAGGITGSVLLTKVGSGTLMFTSTASSARSGTNQIDEGVLRLQAATVITPVGTGAFALNGGTLSLGYDAGGSLTNAVNILSSSTIIVDRASSGAGGFTFSLGAVITGDSTLTVKAGDNVTSGSMGLTLGSITIGGPSMAPGDPVFDVQSTASAAMNLTLGALTDQAIAPRTITFQNSGSTASSVTLATAATSLLDGTVINLASTGGALTLSANITSALGTFAQITVGAGNTLSLGASQTIGALNGSGTVTATANSTLTIGNALSTTAGSSTFNGVLSGSSLSIVKSGSGSLTLGGSDSNTFSGSAGTVINSGTLILAKTGGAVAISTNVTVGTANGTSGTAVLQLNGSEQIASTATLTVNASSTVNLNGSNQTLGNLNGSPGGTIFNNATGTNSTLTIGFGDATGGLYQGSIADNSGGTGTVALTKTGSGTATLGGYNSYSGATLVQDGTLQAGSGGIGTTGTGAVTVQDGATLLGTGIVQGSSFTAAAGSTIQAGDSSAQASFGTLTFKPASGSGVIDFQSGSTVILDITSGGTADLLSIAGTGSNTLLFNGNLTVSATAFVPTVPMVFNLLDWSGLSASPIFASRFNYTGSLFGNGDEASGLDLPDISGTGFYWDISSFTVNGTIILVPEPSRMMLLALGLAMLLVRRRR
ncbi:beta strand repeat-containing protein [Prosthecobacter sp.]|uniref:beta strand repeat-containing protein n=1 Tax=Prosthecobacter sp. TaxID=1965333 RepID=UPI003783E775